MSTIFEFLSESPLLGAFLVGIVMGIACSVYVTFHQLMEYGNVKTMPFLVSFVSFTIGVLGIIVLFQLGLGMLFDGEFMNILKGFGIFLAGLFGVVVIVYCILRNWKMKNLSQKEITKHVLALIDEHKPERVMVCNDGIVLVNGGNVNANMQKDNVDCYNQSSYDRVGSIYGYTSYRSFCNTSFLSVCATVDFAANRYPHLNATLMELFSAVLTKGAKGYKRKSANRYATYTEYTTTGSTYYVSNGVVKGGPDVEAKSSRKLIDCYYVLVNKSSSKRMGRQSEIQSTKNSW